MTVPQLTSPLDMPRTSDPSLAPSVDTLVRTPPHISLINAAAFLHACKLEVGKVMGMGTHRGLWVWVQVGVGVGTGFGYPYPYPYPHCGYSGTNSPF